MVEIIENNKLIAEFMGSEFMQNEIVPMLGHNYPTNEELNFNSDWNWLMPVVGKIYSLNIYYDFITSLGQFGEGVVLNTNINYVYEGVIEFISWYNQNK